MTEKYETKSRPDTGDLNRLFVYGIFLGEFARKNFGMSLPRYSTVKDYATFPIGGHIVMAEPIKGYDLTGLVVNIDPDYWDKLDTLEGAYARVKVKTGYGEAWMYVRPSKEGYVRPS